MRFLSSIKAMEAGLVPMKMVCRPHVLSDLLLSRPAIIIIIIIVVVVVVVVVVVIIIVNIITTAVVLSLIHI